MNILVLSTLPHFYSIVPLLPYYGTCMFGYINVIILSTMCSIFYHLYHESRSIINTIDHVMAFIWFGYDLGYQDIRILSANAVSFLIHTYIPNDHRYTRWHSVWHGFNAVKCYYVATIIQKMIQNNYMV